MVHNADLFSTFARQRRNTNTCIANQHRTPVLEPFQHAFSKTKSGVFTAFISKKKKHVRKNGASMQCQIEIDNICTAEMLGFG